MTLRKRPKAYSLMTYAQAQERLGMSRAALCYHIKRGHLHGYRLPGSKFFGIPSSEVEALKAERDRWAFHVVVDPVMVPIPNATEEAEVAPIQVVETPVEPPIEVFTPFPGYLGSASTLVIRTTPEMLSLSHPSIFRTLMRDAHQYLEAATQLYRLAHEHATTYDRARYDHLYIYASLALDGELTWLQEDYRLSSIADESPDGDQDARLPRGE